MLYINRFQVGLIGRIGFAATRISDYLAVHAFSFLWLGAASPLTCISIYIVLLAFS
ncbi:hypothetical protein [Mycobacteroides abscessus]|uniref:hypothetical protein n=1 Tax=Mycobacteroides abscessus TaxID=36809 RepID=UPI0013F5E7A2|nr:hypothetical protein [Mycobacteroides abscessus]